MFSGTIIWGLLPRAALFLAAICLLVSAIGFRKVVYFISIGYGYSMAAMAVACLLLARGGAGSVTWAVAALIAVYGLRLGTYLAVRESKPDYRASQAPEDKRAGLGALAIRLAIWVSVSALYVALFMPTLSRFAAEASGRSDPLPALSIAGAAIMAAGLFIETLADLQKSRAKKAAPGRFCDSGLYRLSRCPNYFGETLVWTGNLIAGAPLLGNALAWIVAAAGWAVILLIMVGSAKSLEAKQERRYGSDAEFRRYASSVPILVPFLPVYSLGDAKLYLGSR
jgi:steroid 5-alpha reductase family enzyme